MAGADPAPGKVQAKRSGSPTDTDPDWQTERSVLECNRYMLENQTECDITFLLVPADDNNGEAVTVSAHKYVLISRSPVFFAMFTGPLAERDSQVKVTDIPLHCFKMLLR